MDREKTSKNQTEIPTTSLLGTCQRMCSLVGVDVMEDSDEGEKDSRMHMNEEIQSREGELARWHGGVHVCT